MRDFFNDARPSGYADQSDGTGVRGATACGCRGAWLDAEFGASRAVFFYLQELKKWNRQINLTGSADDEFVIRQHFVDSLSCACSPVLSPRARLLDIGAGAGFPGLPLKLYFPEISVTTVDAVTKKIMFLRQLCRGLKLQQVACVAARLGEASEAAAPRAAFDVIVSRAVGDLPYLTALARPYLAPGGHLLLQRGQQCPQEIQACRALFDTQGLAVVDMQTVRLSFLEHPRYLLAIGFQK